MRKRKTYYNSKKQIERLLISRYGITGVDYQKRLEKQGYKCAICRKKQTKKLCVDHCHKTNVVRGLLCQHCNTGLGMFKDSLSSITRAIKYLHTHEKQKEKNRKRKTIVKKTTKGI